MKNIDNNNDETGMTTGATGFLGAGHSDEFFTF